MSHKHESNKIPPYLLEGCSEQDKWLMQNVFDLRQNVNTLTETVDRVESLQKIANGRTAKNESNIEILQQQIKSWVEFKQRLHILVTNKYFIFASSLGIFLCLYPLAIYVSKSGGIISFAESVIKAIWG